MNPALNSSRLVRGRRAERSASETASCVPSGDHANGGPYSSSGDSASPDATRVRPRAVGVHDVEVDAASGAGDRARRRRDSRRNAMREPSGDHTGEPSPRAVGSVSARGSLLAPSQTQMRCSQT